MTKTEYAEYLQSDHWKQIRKDAIADAGAACERCTMPRWLAEIVYDQDLHVHHKNYRSRGKEKWDDLEVLCRRCHEVETFGRSELKEVKTSTCSICTKKHWDRRSDHCPYCTRLLDEGPYGLIKYAGERVPGIYDSEGRNAMLSEVMPHCLSGTEIERHMAIGLARDNPWLTEKVPESEDLIGSRVLTGVWLKFGTDQVLDFIAHLQDRFGDVPVDPEMPALAEKNK